MIDKQHSFSARAALLACLLVGGTAATAQAPSAAPAATAVGRPLGVTEEGRYTPIPANVKVYGAVVSAESCVYDPARKLILAFNRGAQPNQIENDGFVSLIRPDGSVHTPRWIGLEAGGPLLHQPFGSAIHEDTLFVADSTGGTADGRPRVALLRAFDLATGAPSGEIAVPESQWLNDIAIAADGTIYASQTGAADGSVPYRIYRVTREGKVSIFLEGAPLSRPNGVAIDPQGNIVVVNLGDDAVLTFSPAATLVATERAAMAGNDGLVILADGTKYVSSVLHGGVSRIRRGKPAELIASGIPNAASMCHDKDADQLVIPLNANNGLAFVKLGRR